MASRCNESEIMDNREICLLYKWKIDYRWKNNDADDRANIERVRDMIKEELSAYSIFDPENDILPHENFLTVILGKIISAAVVILILSKNSSDLLDWMKNNVLYQKVFNEKNVIVVCADDLTNNPFCKEFNNQKHVDLQENISENYRIENLNLILRSVESLLGASPNVMTLQDYDGGPPETPVNASIQESGNHGRPTENSAGRQNQDLSVAPNPDGRISKLGIFGEYFSSIDKKYIFGFSALGIVVLGYVGHKYLGPPKTVERCHETSAFEFYGFMKFRRLFNF